MDVVTDCKWHLKKFPTTTIHKWRLKKFPTTNGIWHDIYEVLVFEIKFKITILHFWNPLEPNFPNPLALETPIFEILWFEIIVLLVSKDSGLFSMFPHLFLRLFSFHNNVSTFELESCMSMLSLIWTKFKWTNVLKIGCEVENEDDEWLSCKYLDFLFSCWSWQNRRKERRRKWKLQLLTIIQNLGFLILFANFECLINANNLHYMAKLYMDLLGF